MQKYFLAEKIPVNAKTFCVGHFKPKTLNFFFRQHFFFFQTLNCSNSHLYNLDYIILQYSNTHFYNLSDFTRLFSTDFLLLFSVEVGQNLAIGQKDLSPKGLTYHGWV